MKKDTLIKLTSFILAVILIIGFFIYSSYAYLSMKVEGTENKAVSKNSFDVTYSQSSDINVTNANLINDVDKTTEAQLSKFSVTLKDLASAEYSVSLTNLYVSSGFKSQYVKWELVKISGSSESTLASGNFSSCTNCSNGSYQNGTATKTLLSKSSNNKLTKNQAVTLGLRVWLSDAGSSVNQNSLASGSLSGKIDVSVYYTT